MNRARIVSALVAVGSISILAPRVTAQLTEFTWNNPALVGAQNWKVNGNWNTTGWPDDPGRTEPDATTIVPSIGASTSVALTGNLTLDIGVTNVTVASLKLGGTLGAVTTNITSTGGVADDYNGNSFVDAADYVQWRGGGPLLNETDNPGTVNAQDYTEWRSRFGNSVPGKLVFENYEANNTSASPQVCSFNCGAAQITSGGVAGSTNIISARVQINGERLEFAAASTNNITISGPVTFANLTAPASASSIRSFMPTGTKAIISGNLSLVDTVTGNGVVLMLNDNGSVPPTPPATGIANNFATGTLEISGVISGANGQPRIGTQNANGALGTVILSGNNTYTGRTIQDRGNLVLASDNALGADSSPDDPFSGGANYNTGAPSNVTGFNLLSDNDARKISIGSQMSQFQTVTGEHSLEWAGAVVQGNSRAWINLLPAGKELKLSGTHFAMSGSGDTTRLMNFDGTGKTKLTGSFRDKNVGGVITSDGTALGHIRKQGTGVLYISDPGGHSDFHGDVMIEQGNLHLDSDAALGTSARYVNSNGGAIGVDTGTFTDTVLLQKLNAMWSQFPTVINRNTGGLMLTGGESGAAIDFTSGDLANLKNMSVAAPENGISYTGNITPGVDALTSVPTYRLGGGSGALTLPNSQLTGARNVQVTNGGTVVLNGANTYTGTTRIQAKYHNTLQNQAAINGGSTTNAVVYEGTTLAVSRLLDGGVNSSIGSSTSDASNLVIQGSTLQYAGTGSNGTTNRLFTVGTGGAALDASGASGSVMNFTNTGSLVMGLAAAQTNDHLVSGYSVIKDDGTNVADGIANNINTRTRVNLANVDDIVGGMTLVGPGALSGGATIIAATGQNTPVNYPTRTYQNFQVTITTAVAANTDEQDGTVTFGGVARTLTLTGSNTDNNTLRPNIAEATAATGTNTVNVVKNGTSKWILTGNNTYAGTTTVNAGTLLINGTHTVPSTIAGAGAYSVASGGTLGGTGTINLSNNNANVTLSSGAKLAPGASAGTLTLNLGTGNLDLSGLTSGNAGGLKFELGTPEVSGVDDNNDSDHVVLSAGTLNIGTLDFADFAFTNLTGFGVGTYTLFDANSAITGSIGTGTGTISGFNAALSVDGGTNNVLLTVTTPGAGAGFAAAVPEPSSIVLIGIALVITIGGVRRRAQASGAISSYQGNRAGDVIRSLAH